MKRVLVLLLTLILIGTILPPLPARASVETDIRSAVEKEFEKLLTRVNPGESAYDGTFQLLNHALFGGGEALILDENDYAMGMILNSNLYRSAFLDTVTAALQNILSSYQACVNTQGSVSWYDHGYSYSHAVIDDMGTPEEDDDRILQTLLGSTNYEGPVNSFDEAMVLVGGGTYQKIFIRQTDVSKDTRTYHLTVRLGDSFDFDASYSQSNNADIAKVLTWMGKLLEAGTVVKTFDWSFSMEFSVTFPYRCSHQSQNYRWEFGNETLIPVSADGFTSNPGRSLQYINTQTGERTDPYFYLQDILFLRHDLPWVIEFRMNSESGTMCLSEASSIYADSYFLMKSYNIAAFVDTERIIEGEKNRSIMHRYGVLYAASGYSPKNMHTYRWENRVDSDGSNMVYLSIDGQDLGPMNHYYQFHVDGSSGNIDQNTTVDWINGKNLILRYLFNSSFRYTPDIKVAYLQIWENGEGAPPASHVTSQTITPQPGSQGYQLHTCSKCGASWKDSFTAALPDGLAGAWETDITLSAADLGVNTPDARLRCTLTFGSDGTVKADWKAIDLSAFREFYHTLFVNAYYACAYGAGMTELSQVEQTCLETNGMSVSDYIYSFLDSFDINALFTPAPSSGTYKTQDGQLYTDLPIMGKPSDADTPNPYTLNGSTLTWTAASYGLPDYTFHCSKR